MPTAGEDVATAAALALNTAKLSEATPRNANPRFIPFYLRTIVFGGIHTGRRREVAASCFDLDDYLPEALRRGKPSRGCGDRGTYACEVNEPDTGAELQAFR
ncbi:MAG: hypothetical protein M3025_05960, partial [Actinomycetota bacterium]|nr:hypothetical protein [Actinomycetota bacterium]